MDFDPDDVVDDDSEAEFLQGYSEFGQSHTSFKSMMSAASGATVMTQGQRDIKKLVKKKIAPDEDLDQVVENLLDAHRKKNKKLTRQFQEQNEAW